MTERALNQPPWPPRTGAQLTQQLEHELWFERALQKAKRTNAFGRGDDDSQISLAAWRYAVRRLRVEQLQQKGSGAGYPPWATSFGVREETFR